MRHTFFCIISAEKAKEYYRHEKRKPENGSGTKSPRTCKKSPQARVKNILKIAVPILAIVILAAVIIWDALRSENDDSSSDTQQSENQQTEEQSETYQTDTSLTVEDGDTVNIDYVGTVDGVEFEGGSTDGNGTDLVIGSGRLY